MKLKLTSCSLCGAEVVANLPETENSSLYEFITRVILAIVKAKESGDADTTRLAMRVLDVLESELTQLALENGELSSTGADA